MILIFALIPPILRHLRKKAEMMSLSSLSVELDLWKAQNAYFSITKKLYRSMQERAEKGVDLAKRWIELFHRLGDRLHVKVA